MSQDQGGQIASREQLREDSEISELTQEYEDAVCEAPLQIQCLDNAISAASIENGPSPQLVGKKCHQKDGKDSIEAFRSIDKES